MTALIGLYLEGYNTSAGARLPLNIAVRTESGRMLFTDSVSIAHRQNLYSGVLFVPISRTGIGPVVVSVWQSGMKDTTRAPLFIGFGDDLPVATYDDMISYLKWFAAPESSRPFATPPWSSVPRHGRAFVRQNASLTGGAKHCTVIFCG